MQKASSRELTVNKTALVIGGGTGIGYATARKFAESGAQVAITSRDLKRAEEASQRLLDFGYESIPLAVDVCSAASVQLGVEAVIQKWGKLDFAFNNAGWEGEPGPTEEISESSWAKMIDIKLSGVWRGMRAELKYMRQQGFGSIVNMAGNWGLVGFSNFSSYCAAAHGIVGLTKAAAKEVASAGLRVNCICPGAVDAPMLDRMVDGNEAVKQGFADQLAIGRLCTVDEVASAVTWLCSSEASYSNGITLPLDGSGY